MMHPDDQVLDEQIPPEAPAAEETVAEATEVPPVAPPAKELPVKLVRQAFKPLTEAVKKRDLTPVPIMAFQYSKLEQQWKSWRPIESDDDNAQTLRWAEASIPAQNGALSKDLYTHMFESEQSNWSQRPSIGGATVAPRIHDGGVSKLSGHVELSGSKFVNALRRVRSSGATIQIPLIHSGFWIYIKPSRLIRRVALDAQRLLSRVSLGRDTSGLIFSARGALEQKDIFEFAIEHVVGANIEGYDIDRLRQCIKVPDLAIIAYACALAHHPDGFPHSIPCHHNPQNCRHVEEVLLDLSACYWSNLDKLNDFQRQLISRRTDVKWSEIEKYQSEGLFASGEELRINEDTTFVTKIPTADEYFAEATQWADYIKQNIEKVLGDDVTDQMRMYQLSQGLEATRMREYAPWVKKYNVSNGDVVISAVTADDVIHGLEEDSPDTRIAESLEKQIKQYIEKITAAAVGYPQFQCPACQMGLSVTDSEFSKMSFESIVALDPFKHFFHLMGQDAISNRS